MCELCVFLHSIVKLCAVLCVHLVFLADEIAYKQIKNLWYLRIFFFIVSFLETNLCVQNKRYSQTDCITKYRSVVFLTLCYGGKKTSK